MDKSIYENIINLTIGEAEFPAGRSVTDDELAQKEYALFRLLYSYSELKLKSDLRSTLHLFDNNQKEYRPYVVSNYQLMKPVELYRLIDAADVLKNYLTSRYIARLEKFAASGDQDAVEVLRQLQ